MDRDKAPREKKTHNTHTMVLISSFSLTSRCHPPAERARSPSALQPPWVHIQPGGSEISGDIPQVCALAVMENVELCFQWRVHGSAQHQLAVELYQWGEHQSALCTRAPSDGSRAQPREHTSRPQGEINYPLGAQSHVYLMWRGRGARADRARNQIFYS